MSTLDELRQLLQQDDQAETRLDDLVHDAASDAASRANNEGMAGQLRFLHRLGYTDAYILAAVRDE